MKKIIFSFLFIAILNAKASSALEFSCNFEEVHSNGTVNQGLVLYKNKKLRYEYLSPNLFIIFSNENGVFVYDKEKKVSKPIKRHIDIIDHLISLAEQYPEIPKKIENDNLIINIDTSETNNFIKRISIDSDRAKLSLHLNNCDLIKPINNLFFNEERVFNYR